MTALDSIDGLHAALDARWDDQTLRLVLADALEESGVPGLVRLAPGYRALAVWDRVPDMGWPTRYMCGCVHYGSAVPMPPYWPPGDPEFVGEAWDEKGPDRCHLPGDWVGVCGNLLRNCTRREADDWAADRFATLPPERQAELLGGPA